MQRVSLCCTSVVVCCVLFLGGFSAASAKSVQLNFQDVELRKMVKVISSITGKTIVVDPRVKGRATIYSAKPVESGEVFSIFQSVLEVHGYTIINTGSAYKVVPAQTAKGSSVALSSGKEVPSDGAGKMVTHTVTLEHSSGREAVDAIKPLISPQGAVSVHASTNLLIITDYQSNIQRLLSIIAKLDTIESNTVEVFALQHGMAEEVAERALAALAVYRKGLENRGVGITIEPDGRSNSIVVFAPMEEMGRIADMVAAFDQPTARGQDGFRHIALRNAKAEEVAKVLTALVSRKSAGTRAGKDGVVVSGPIRVVADKSTNSLLLAAAPEDFVVLRGVVDKLDIRRRQVYVEAMVVETNSDFSFNAGINWGYGRSVDGTGFFGGTNTGSSGVGAAGDNGMLALPSGLSAGLVTFPITLGGLNLGSLQSVVNLSKVSTGVRVLATPQIMTMDNEKAKVVVADNIPFSTKVTLGTSTSDASQSFQYKDVGFTLEILPQISEGGNIRLQVRQEVSRIVATSVASGSQTLLAPKTQRRELETTIQVEDGQTVVLAGLLSSKDEEGDGSVPGISEIPVVGNLFKRKKKERAKTNLMLFLHPKIIYARDEMQALYADKRSLLEEITLGTSGMPKPMLIAPRSGVPMMWVSDSVRPVIEGGAL